MTTSSLSTSTRAREPWSEDEDRALLLMHDGRMSLRRIGQVLRRSEEAVRRRFEILDAERAWLEEAEPLRLGRAGRR